MERLAGIKLLEETIGIRSKILPNGYQEIPFGEDQLNLHQKIILQVKEEEPDDWAIWNPFLYLPIAGHEAK